jgi:hypothetical protein
LAKRRLGKRIMEKFSVKRRRKIIKTDDLVVIFDILTVVNMKIMVFWVVMPYNLVDIKVLEEPAASIFRAALMSIKLHGISQKTVILNFFIQLVDLYI